MLSPHPGQVKAELNAHSYGHEKSDGFAALENRIHTMLFAEQQPAPFRGAPSPGAPSVTRAARP